MARSAKRSKSLEVTPVGSDRVAFRLGLEDKSFAADGNELIHALEIEGELSVPELEILWIEPRTIHQPYTECAASLEPVRRMAGARVGPGFRARVIEVMGRERGCTHFLTLVLDLAAAHTLSLFLRMRERATFVSRNQTASPWMRAGLELEPRLENACVTLQSSSAIIRDAKAVNTSVDRAPAPGDAARRETVMLGAAIADRSELDDLLSDEATNDPVAYYRKLRAIHPVYWNARWNGWIVTSYEAVVAGYRNWQALSSDRFSGPFAGEMQRSASTYQQLIGFLSRFFVWKDPPFHTGMRLLVNQAFTPKSVELIRPRVQSLVHELAQPLRGRADVDFFAEFAFTLPVVVIAEFLGIPKEARFEVREWSDDLAAVVFTRGNETDRMQKGENAMRKLVEFLRPIIRARRDDPQDDLLTRLASAEVDGERLSEEDVIANAVLMVFAGHETTMNLLANGMVAFSRFPDQWHKLAREPALARSAADEILRYDGPIKALGRWAKEPLDLFGQHIARNDRVLLVQHAANRDPAAFADPDRLDIARTPNRHAAFGQGIHTCLGAPLARLEVQEALAYLTAQFSGLEILEPELRYNATVVARSLQRLHVRFLDK